MERRVFLVAAGAAALSGCASVDSEDEVDDIDEIETPASTPQEVPLAEQGFPGTIREEEPNLDLIEAIDDPAFARDWSDLEVADRYRHVGGLADDSVVIGLTNGERARAYPLEVLRIHEVVDDHFGSPVLVSYCPLCRSGMVARRIVDDDPTRFGVSGLLWKPPGLRTAQSEQKQRVFGVDPGGAKTDVRRSGNLVLFDAKTGSYWSQLLARAICGPRRGDELEMVPSEVTTWGEWRDEHPDAEIMVPPPGSSAENPTYPD